MMTFHSYTYHPTIKAGGQEVKDEVVRHTIPPRSHALCGNEGSNSLGNSTLVERYYFLPARYHEAHAVADDERHSETDKAIEESVDVEGRIF